MTPRSQYILGWVAAAAVATGAVAYVNNRANAPVAPQTSIAAAPKADKASDALLQDLKTTKLRHAFTEQELNVYVKQNPTQGYYQCLTQGNKVMKLYVGKPVEMSANDPLRPDTCHPHLNINTAPLVAK